MSAKRPRRKDPKAKAVSTGRLSDAASTARRSGLTPQQLEVCAEAFANQMIMETGSQRFAAACYLLWIEGISPLKRNTPKHRSSDANRNAWEAYKAKAWELTRMQPIESLENYEKRSFLGWHIDHVLSIHEAFKRGLPPEVPACISNLRMMPANENLLKNTRSVFTDLFNLSR